MPSLPALVCLEAVKRQCHLHFGNAHNVFKGYSSLRDGTATLTENACH